MGVYSMQESLPTLAPSNRVATILAMVVAGGLVVLPVFISQSAILVPLIADPCMGLHCTAPLAISSIVGLNGAYVGMACYARDDAPAVVDGRLCARRVNCA
jgi:UPF0716 family protein affecting phage T7 exclusion